MEKSKGRHVWSITYIKEKRHVVDNHKIEMIWANIKGREAKKDYNIRELFTINGIYKANIWGIK